MSTQEKVTYLPENGLPNTSSLPIPDLVPPQSQTPPKSKVNLYLIMLFVFAILIGGAIAFYLGLRFS